MGNINKSLSHCEFNLFNDYELDWISEKTWEINTFENKSDFFNIQKGILNIETNKIFNINLSKKIENLKNINNLIIPINIDYILKTNYYLNISLSNSIDPNSKNQIILDKIIFTEDSILFLKKNNIYENFKVDKKKNSIKYNLKFNNIGLIIIIKKFLDVNNKVKKIFNLNYYDSVYININIYTKNNSENINSFKLNL